MPNKTQSEIARAALRRLQGKIETPPEAEDTSSPARTKPRGWSGGGETAPKPRIPKNSGHR